MITSKAYGRVTFFQQASDVVPTATPPVDAFVAPGDAASDTEGIEMGTLADENLLLRIVISSGGSIVVGVFGFLRRVVNQAGTAVDASGTATYGVWDFLGWLNDADPIAAGAFPECVRADGTVVFLEKFPVGAAYDRILVQPWTGSGTMSAYVGQPAVV
jgi:hypothetical protein